MNVTEPRSAFAQNAAQAATDSTKADSKISSDFDTFLQLLTAQMKNQDPLNPVKSEDFATQLATFSNVEQSVLTNDLLKEIKTSFLESESGSLLGYVGMDVRAPGPAAYDGSTPVDLFVQPQSGASQAALYVYDANGNLVDSQHVTVGQAQLSWDGKDADGNALPEGIYQFEYEQTLSDTQVSVATPEVFGHVIEARRGAGGMQLVTAAGGEFGEDAISVVRQPQA